MLSGIFDILKSIGEFFVLLFDVIVTFFTDLIMMLTSLYATVQALPMYFAWLPAAFTSLLAVTFIIVILLRVLGRD